MNHYSEAIEIITGEHDWKQIVIEISKKHPKLVVSAANSQGWRAECKILMNAGDKVGAIKRCRAITGFGLKESKEMVDSLV